MKKWLVAIFFVLCIKPVAAVGLQSRIVSTNVTYSTENSRELTDLRVSLKADMTAPDSAIQILLYAVSNTATASDKLADINAYDIGEIGVECPDSIPGIFDFGEPIIETAPEANYQLNGREYYHRITCPYTGTGDVTQADFGYNNDNYLTIKNLINPRFDPSLPESQLIYAPIWARFTSFDRYVQLTVASARNVEMWAVIMPQISFELQGLPAGGRYCGVTNEKTTSGTLADFGTVTNLRFFNVAQRLIVSTNMMHGYVVTAISDDQMRLVDQTPAVVCAGNGSGNDACVPSARVGGMTSAQAKQWSNIDAGRGYGYTLENVIGNDTVFDYTDGYRYFADAQNGEEPVAILRSNEGRYSDNNICYRIVATDDNIHGTYQNHLTYTITVKF